MIDKIKEIAELFKRKDALLAELTQLINDKGEEQRIFKDEDIVEVMNSHGDVVCDGIVVGAFSWAAVTLQPFELIEYARNPEKFDKALREMRYKVKALKKDGTKSERNAGGRASYPSVQTRYEYYIRRKH